MESKIKKLEKAVCDLTDAIKGLKASIQVSESNGNHSRTTQALPILNNPSMDVLQTVCPNTNCGVINAGTITCDHTFARYRSEYNCG